MQYNKLWNTDIEVSKICMGTMVRWNGYKWTEQSSFDQMDMAIDHGVNFFDTAEIYAIPPQEDTQGNTEKIVGSWMKARGNRKDIILATKVAWPSGFKRMRNGEWHTPNVIRGAIQGSLERLQTDYVDLYQLHRPQRPVQIRGKMNYDDHQRDAENKYVEQIIETLEVLQTLQEEGKIRHFGLSNETPWGTMKFLELAKKYDLPRMQSVQNAYNLNRREYETGLSEISLYENIGLLAYSPLAWGILSEKYQWGQKPENARYSTRGESRMPYYTREKSIDAVNDYQKIADELEITVTQLALAWINDRSFVTSNIIGTTDTIQLKECLSSADITLTAETYKKIDEVFAKNANPACW